MRTGILTFHCSDNFGAMLQAYGLKTFLKTIEPNTEIVPYEPFFMKGRHWLIPWYPGISPKAMLRSGVCRLRTISFDYILQKKRMKAFRTRYLTQSLRPVRTLNGLKHLTYEAYVLGSDQIWNPAITFGLRKAYFGAFSNRYKKHVIAYAASLGGSSLDDIYDQEMHSLLSCVDRISVREKAAVPYVSRIAGKKVSAVVDPVFLLDVEEWKKIETLPKKRNHVLVYKTEKSEKLMEYAKRLAAAKNLPVIELKYQKEMRPENKQIIVETGAGPAEFLGYIHHADYVVTNSFHAMAFSIIYQKKFLAFEHNTRNARLENVLEQCGLGERMVGKGSEPHDIDAAIDWIKVKENMKQMRKDSILFLKESMDVQNIEK